MWLRRADDGRRGELPCLRFQVAQLLRLNPSVFEFTEELLAFIYDHVHSGAFGTFYGNSPKARRRRCFVKALQAQTHANGSGFVRVGRAQERHELGLAERTTSLWRYIGRVLQANPAEPIRNHLYIPTPPQYVVAAPGYRRPSDLA